MKSSNSRPLLPIFEWLPAYQRADFRGDLAAGLTVAVMLIPQGMAYAMLAGLPPIYGLYASTVPVIIYALMGSSRQLAVGPVAMVALLIASGVSHLAEPGSSDYIALAILLALMVGVIQLALGLLRLGFAVNFLSHPVISGFTSAAALIIGLSQLKYLLGVDIPRSHHIHEILINAVSRIGEVNWPTLALGLVAVGLILGLKRVNRLIPGPLVAVVIGILAVVLLDLHGKGLRIVADIPEGLPAFSLPTLDMANMRALLPAALTISLIGFVESFAVAKAIQNRHKNYRIDANQELVALGLANIGGSLFNAFPTTGGFSRTAVNDQAGAKTGMASLITAFIIMLTLLFLTPLFYYLPKAVLAAIIMVAVFGLIDLKEPRALWRSDRTDFFMLLITFIGTLTLGIEMGIGIGIVLSLLMVIYRSAYPHIAVLGNVTGTAHYRNVARFPDAVQRDDILVVRPDAQLFFANVSFVVERFRSLEAAKDGNLRLVILSAQAINGLDSTAGHALHDLVSEYRKRKVQFYVTGLKGPVRDIMERSGLIEYIDEENFFMHVHEAVEAYDARRRKLMEL